MKRIKFTPGSHHLCECLRAAGFRLAVVSGGFTEFARYARKQLGLHYAFANTMEFIDGLLYLSLFVNVICSCNCCFFMCMLNG